MQDLSHLCGDTGNTLIGGESMSGGNTVNYPTTSIGAAPGSMPVNLPHKNATETLDSPDLISGPENDGIRKPKIGHGVTNSDATYKKAGE